ncbi:hypothetical protein JMJ77_0015341, partial [Colletotrichum scovillei]
RPSIIHTQDLSKSPFCQRPEASYTSTTTNNIRFTPAIRSLSKSSSSYRPNVTKPVGKTDTVGVADINLSPFLGNTKNTKEHRAPSKAYKY